MAFRSKVTKTYEKNVFKASAGHGSSVSSLKPGKSKRKNKIKIKELPPRVGEYSTEESLNFEPNDTFDKLVNGPKFNKVAEMSKVVKYSSSESDMFSSTNNTFDKLSSGPTKFNKHADVSKINSESDMFSSNSNVISTFHSPMMTSKNKNSSLKLFEIKGDLCSTSPIKVPPRKKTALEEPVTVSLSIEKENNNPNVSSLSYIKIPKMAKEEVSILTNSNKEDSKIELTYKPLFSDTFREKQTVYSSTPCLNIPAKRLIADRISPITILVNGTRQDSSLNSSPKAEVSKVLPPTRLNFNTKDFRENVNNLFLGFTDQCINISEKIASEMESEYRRADQLVKKSTCNNNEIAVEIKNTAKTKKRYKTTKMSKLKKEESDTASDARSFSLRSSKTKVRSTNNSEAYDSVASRNEDVKTLCDSANSENFNESNQKSPVLNKKSEINCEQRITRRTRTRSTKSRSNKNDNSNNDCAELIELLDSWEESLSIKNDRVTETIDLCISSNAEESIRKDEKLEQKVPYVNLVRSQEFNLFKEPSANSTPYRKKATCEKKVNRIELKSPINILSEDSIDGSFVKPTIPSKFISTRKSNKVQQINSRRLTLKAGKGYRRSINVCRPSLVILEKSVLCAPDCRCFQCSAAILPQISENNEESGLQSYVRRKSSYVLPKSDFIESILDDSIRNLSLNPKESFIEALPAVTAKDIVLRRCCQTEPLPFEQCYPKSFLANCQKIGEGVYGEVFLCKNPKGGMSVMKVIPIEGDQIVNGEHQKKYDEILSEIVIAMELSNLRHKLVNKCDGFNEVQNVRCVKGQYPERLLDLWDLFDETRGSENDSPRMFTDDQLYIVLELDNGGQDLEAFIFNNAVQAFSMFKQTACALAAAESQLKFEHRDLHWGNILIKQVDSMESFNYFINGIKFDVASEGIQVSIIDFTLSRIEFDGVVIFNDLGLDSELFQAEGDYQFEIYRLMQKHNRNNWQDFQPFSNILWLHYILDKAITSALRYKNRQSKVHKKFMAQLKKYKDEILNFKNVADFVSSAFL